jgi:hypothetical protein
MKWNKLITPLCIISTYVCIHQAANLFTDGFRYQDILSSYQAEGDTTSKISSDKMDLLKTILDQNFYYLGRGRSCYCFESKDQQHVIKFFIHDQLDGTNFLTKLPFANYLNAFKIMCTPKKNKNKKFRRKEFVFNSIKIAETEMKEETGLVHAQLSKNPDLDFPITFFDKIGVKHKINLKDTEFIIQKKATLLFAYLTGLIKERKIDDAKNGIDSFVFHIQDRCNKGIMDWNPCPSGNYGFIQNKAVEVDIGSYSYCEEIKSKANQKLETKKILQSIQKQIHQLGSYELEKYFNEKIENP